MYIHVITFAMKYLISVDARNIPGTTVTSKNKDTTNGLSNLSPGLNTIIIGTNTAINDVSIITNMYA